MGACNLFCDHVILYASGQLCTDYSYSCALLVGWLVQQQQVAALPQRLCEVQAVALATRQAADLLLLVGALQ